MSPIRALARWILRDEPKPDVDEMRCLRNEVGYLRNILGSHEDTMNRLNAEALDLRAVLAEARSVLWQWAADDKPHPSELWNDFHPHARAERDACVRELGAALGEDVSARAIQAERNRRFEAQRIKQYLGVAPDGLQA